MKKKKRFTEKPQQPAAVRSYPLWPYAAALAALFITFGVYSPALHGQFLFDDQYLPFTAEDAAEIPLWNWISGVRPLLMLTFWINLKLFGLEPFSYHALNVLLHLVASTLIYLIARSLLEAAGETGRKRELLAGFTGALFLLHPVQTESVAYVASRSETLSGTLFFGALALFLYRRSRAISWIAAAGVVVLYAAAVTTKEHTAVLIFVLLLTDYYWNPGFSLTGIRGNWRLYAPIMLAGTAAGAFVWRVLRTADTAGFALEEVSWYEYFFTQGRAIWLYVRLFVLPYGQNLDYDFPYSRTIFERGAIFGLAALLAAAVAAIAYRRRFPLASYGLLFFLLTLAPTSSVVPIMDPAAERRLYLALPGLLLIALEILRRMKSGQGTLASALACILVVAAALTWNRNHVWANGIALWEDTISKSPNKARPHSQLAFAYFEQGRCEDALKHYAITGKLMKPDYRLLVNWSIAFSCAGKSEEALDKLRQAANLQKTAQVYSLMGRVYAIDNRPTDALEALDTAIKLNPRYELAYVYRGNVYAGANQFDAAMAEYRQALAINPRSESAHQAIATVEALRRGLR